MTCVHLKKLFQLCDDNELKFSSGDLVRIVCKQCQQQEVCPSLLLDQGEAEEPTPPSDEKGSVDPSEQDRQ